ncbi:MAG: ABC transporter substrate-binding protein [Cypionkella sp.]
MATLAMGAVAMAFAGIVPASAQQTTITYLASQGWVQDAELELGKRFESKTGIHVDYQIIPSDQYFNVLRTKLNSGEVTDIFGGQSGVTDLQLQYDVEKNALDLSAEPWVANLDPLVAEQSTVNGKLYGLTYWDTVSGAWVINYNKAIFAEHGLAVPKTYAEFATICKTLLDAGIQPIYEPVSDGWHHVLWFPELGPRFEQATPGLAAALNANTKTFAEDATALTALTQLNELYHNGCFGQNALSDAFSDATKVMSGGQAAMVLANTAFSQQIKADYPDVDPANYGVFVMPLADNQRLNVNPAGPTMFISATSQNIDAAKQYLQFLVEPENMKYFVENTPQATGLPLKGAPSNLTPDLKAFLDSFADNRGTVYQTAVTYVNPQWMDIGKDLTAMFTDAMQPADVLSSLDSRRTDLAHTAKDPAWQ